MLKKELQIFIHTFSEGMYIFRFILENTIGNQKLYFLFIQWEKLKELEWKIIYLKKSENFYLQFIDKMYIFRFNLRNTIDNQKSFFLS